MDPYARIILLKTLKSTMLLGQQTGSKYSRTSIDRTALELCKYVRDKGSSS